MDSLSHTPAAFGLIVLSAFLAGTVHVVTGPDHLAAIAPIAAGHRGKRPWWVGFQWGLGHSGGVALIGLLLLSLKHWLPLESFSAWSERLVGVTLLGVAFWAIRKATSRHLHAHAHAHGDDTHLHIHMHDRQSSHEPSSNPNPSHRHSHAAFGIGTLHGFAGSSHFFGVLPALALPNTSGTLAYLLSYTAGTVFSMATFAGILGWLSARLLVGRGIAAYRYLVGSLGCTAAAVGIFWIIQGSR